MKNVISPRIATALLVLVVVSALVGGCTKPPKFKADPTDPYASNNPPEQGTAGPVFNSFTPTSGLPNTVIHIAGYNFAGGIANTKLTINGQVAVINAITSTGITATIPANATTGKLELTSGSTVITSTVNFNVLSGTMSTFADLGSKTLEHISFDANGNLYGEDEKTIYKISPLDGLTTYAGLNNEFKSLWGSVIDRPTGDIYVPDRIAHTIDIVKVSPEKVIAATAGSGIEGLTDGQGINATFATPIGIAIDQAGNLYVNDTRRVRKIATTGVVTTIAGGSSIVGHQDGKGAAAGFGSLEGIVVDADGNIYVSDTKYLNIRKITPDGVVTTLAGSGMAGFNDGEGTTAQFTRPGGLAVDPAGNILVADANSALPVFAVRMINKLGVVTTLLKGTSATGIINGPLSSASTNAPDGMTFDSSGNLYISNTGAHIISKITFK